MNAVPHLVTAQSGPLPDLEKLVLQKHFAIESWLRAQFMQTPPPPYCSVDLRNAGFKVAPVDTNLFPAGFNNLNPDFLPLCVQAVQAYMQQHLPRCQRILLIPENHTRNLFYLESVAVIQIIFQQAGYDMRIGSLLPEITAPLDIELPSGKILTLSPLIRQGQRLGLADFDPCVILLNHDLSGGIPDILENVEQKIIPPLALGWSSRLKSKHFQHYANVANEFAAAIDIDPWLIQAFFAIGQQVDFAQHQGETDLMQAVENVLQQTTQKYAQLGIARQPFVIVKADAGTYGMGIMTVRHAKQIKELNRKARAKMATTKGGQAITQVLIQEGVPTIETWGKQHAVAEPVVYMIGQYVIGGFYRVHQARGPEENLNATGMKFERLFFAKTCHCPEPGAINCDNRFYLYGVIARLALLAAARELQEVTLHG